MIAMMLTKKDLKKIGEVIRDEVFNIIGKENLHMKRFVLRTMKDEVDPLRKNINQLVKDMKLIKGQLKRISSGFDTEIVDLQKNVDRIKDHLDLPKLN